MIDHRVCGDRLLPWVREPELRKPPQELRKPVAGDAESDAIKRILRAARTWLPVKSASFVLPPSLEIISGPPSAAHGSHSGTTCNPSVRSYHRAASYRSGTNNST